MSRVDWSAPGALDPIRTYSTDAEYRPDFEGFAGAAGVGRPAGRMEEFGLGGWAQGWRWDDGLIGRVGALGLYEDAYLEHFRRNQEVLCLELPRGRRSSFRGAEGYGFRRLP